MTTYAFYQTPFGLLKTGIANFTLGFVKGEYIYTSDTFQLETQAR